MDETETHSVILEPRGAELCLDFANTVDWHASEHPVESINTYSDLLHWSQRAGILTDEEARCLLQEAVRRPQDAVAARARAIDLREAIYRVFSAVVGGRSAEPDDLAALNAALDTALTHLRVIPAAAGFTWGWVGGESDLERMLWPVARSAANLLTSTDLDRVRECAGDPCGWLFVDTSRNRSRRWCDMKSCGNRAKARRHYERTRSAE